MNVDKTIEVLNKAQDAADDLIIISGLLCNHADRKFLMEVLTDASMRLMGIISGKISYSISLLRGEEK